MDWASQLSHHYYSRVLSVNPHHTDKLPAAAGENKLVRVVYTDSQGRSQEDPEAGGLSPRQLPSITLQTALLPRSGPK